MACGPGMVASWPKSAACWPNLTRADQQCRTGDAELAARALAYKQVLSLMIAQRRPSYYLGGSETALENLTDRHLRLLGELAVIPPRLRDAALEAKSWLSGATIRHRATCPSSPQGSHCAAHRHRRPAGVPRLYDLDRLDLSAQSTLHAPVQSAVTTPWLAIGDPDVARKSGLMEHRLFAPGDDPAKVLFSFTLFERVGDANLLRIQTDNLDAPSTSMAARGSISAPPPNCGRW